MSDYGIRSRAVLVKIAIPGAQSKRKSKDATREVARSMSADEASISCVINIMPDEFVKAINTAIGRIRSENYMLTLPWGDDKSRLLSVDILEKHKEAMEKRIPEYDAEVDRVAESMPAIIQAARFRLGSAFDESMYPSPAAFKAKMKVRISYYPIPAGEDFRIGLDADTISYMRRELEEEVTDRINASIADVRERIAKVVGSFIERLEKVVNYRDGNGKQRTDGHVRKSVVTNIQELLEIIPALNITSNQEIVDLSNMLRKDLCSYSADTLNDSPPVRSAMISRAKHILSLISK